MTQRFRLVPCVCTIHSGSDCNRLPTHAHTSTSQYNVLASEHSCTPFNMAIILNIRICFCAIASNSLAFILSLSPSLPVSACSIMERTLYQCNPHLMFLVNFGFACTLYSQALSFVIFALEHIIYFPNNFLTRSFFSHAFAVPWAAIPFTCSYIAFLRLDCEHFRYRLFSSSHLNLT